MVSASGVPMRVSFPGVPLMTAANAAVAMISAKAAVIIPSNDFFRCKAVSPRRSFAPIGHPAPSVGGHPKVPAEATCAVQATV